MMSWAKGMLAALGPFVADAFFGHGRETRYVPRNWGGVLNTLINGSTRYPRTSIYTEVGVQSPEHALRFLAPSLA